MAARAIWKGQLQLGSHPVPVKLYSAVEDRNIHFRLLDTRRKEPVEQRMVDPSTGKVVPADEIHKAFEENGEFVLLNEDELDSLEPEASREIAITRFVDPDEISHQWYDRPYYLGPDGDVGDYFALAAAMRKQGKDAIVRWVMRKKEYVGALRVDGDYLMLITLRHADEVVPASALTAPGGRKLDERELKMARQLIDALSDDLDFAAFHDEYRERVMELIEAKAAGKVIKFPKPPAKAKEKSLRDVLERSLAAAEKERASA